MKTQALYLTVVGSVLLGGCAQIRQMDDPTIKGPFHTAVNVHVTPNGLPATFQRVAVLPLIHGRGNRGAERGVPLVRQVFTQELSRARVFDVVTITPEQLYTMAGVRAVYADQKLPVGLIDKIKEVTGCQGVLFAELTTYRAYPPVAVGWKLHLFDLETEELLWATDEVYDAGQAPVANALRRHLRDSLAPNLVAPPKSIVLDSPRELARFSLHDLIGILIEKNAKVGFSLAEDTGSQRGSGTTRTESEQPEPAVPALPAVPETPETNENLTPASPEPGAL